MIGQLGGYGVIEAIGRGGMGVVYRAEQIALGREVALKVIAPEFAADPEFRRRFEREYRTAASLDHPNVVTIYEAGEADGVLFIAMRLVRGEDLRELVVRQGSLSPARAAFLVSQVGAALDAAHAAGLVHRDVKPANVLVSRNGGPEHAYLSDFGLTKHVTSHGGLTRTGQWVGTVDYIAPELVEGRPADARSDVYSLGCVLFEALTGQVPFPREAQMAKLYAHVQAPPPVPSAVRPGLPPALDHLVLRALEKDPNARPQSAGDLGRQAVAAAEGRAAPSPHGSVAAGAAAPGSAAPPAPPAPPSYVPTVGPQPTPRGRAMPVAILVAALILAIGGVAAALIATGALEGKSTKQSSTRAGVSGGGSPTPGVPLEPYTAPTYTAQLPTGWTVEEDYHDYGTHIRTRRSRGNESVLIDTSPNVNGDDPGQSAANQEPHGDPAYRRLRWRYFDLNGLRAFDWGYEEGAKRYDVIYFYAGGNGYGVLGEGPPSRYRETLAITRDVAASVRPR